jgi:Holliday junction resolvase RusA-like endonuclease
MRSLIVGALPQNQGIFFPEAVPLKVVVKFYMPRPDNHFPRRDAFSLALPNLVDRMIDNVFSRYRSTPHLRTPDADNMVKFVLDHPLQGVIYANDSFVTEITAEKMFDDTNECTGRTYIAVTKAE